MFSSGILTFIYIIVVRYRAILGGKRTKGTMARPGGNPGLKKHQFKSPYDEPATDFIGIRVPPSLNKKLKALGKNRMVLIRKALEDLVAGLPESS